MASDIAEARGICGTNAEYLLRLARFMREEVPYAWDEHLYHLEHLVRARLDELKVSVDELLDSDPYVSTVPERPKKYASERRVERQKSPERAPGFASHVPMRKLKCLDL